MGNNPSEERDNRGKKDNLDISIIRTKIFRSHDSSVYDIIISKGWIISASQDKTLKVFSIDMGLIKSYEHDFPIYSLDCDFKQGNILCGDSNGCVLLLSNEKLNLRKIATFQVAQYSSNLGKVIVIQNEEYEDDNVTFITFCSFGISKGHVYMCQYKNSSIRSPVNEESILRVKIILQQKHLDLNCIHLSQLSRNRKNLFVSATSPSEIESLYMIDLQQILSPNENDHTNSEQKTISIHSKYEDQVTCISSFINPGKRGSRDEERIVCGTLSSIIISDIRGLVLRNFEICSPCECLLIMDDLTSIIFGRDDGNICYVSLPYSQPSSSVLSAKKVNDGIRKNSNNDYPNSKNRDENKDVEFLIGGRNNTENSDIISGSVLCCKRLNRNQFVSSSDDGSVIVWSVVFQDSTQQQQHTGKKNEFSSFIDSL